MESSSTRKSSREIEAGGSCMFQVSLIYIASSWPDLAIQNKSLSEQQQRHKGLETKIKKDNCIFLQQQKLNAGIRELIWPITLDIAQW